MGDFEKRFETNYPRLSLRLQELGMNYQTFFTTAEAAPVLRKSPRTLQRYVKQGKLQAKAIGRLKFHAEDLERVLREGLLQ